MRKHYLLISLLCFGFVAFTALAYSANFSAVTGDNEVTDQNQVKVQRVVTVEHSDVYDLASLATWKARIEARIAKLQAELDNVEALITAITPIAEGVKLKVKEVEPIEEPVEK